MKKQNKNKKKSVQPCSIMYNENTISEHNLEHEVMC